MYHNAIPDNQRQKYLDLLSQAEEMLPSLILHPEHLDIVREAASAVRGSEEVLRRIKLPLTVQHIAILTDLLKTSRTYVNNFWQAVNEQTTPSIPMPTTQSQFAKSSSPLCSDNIAEPYTSPNPSSPYNHIVTDYKDSSPLTDHLSQYLHTLSEKLQRQATRLPSKYAELNDMHETLDRLVRSSIFAHPSPTSPLSSQKEIAYYANRVNTLVNTIDAFWLRVHAERQVKNENKPITAEYQRFLDEQERKYPMDEPTRSWCDYSKVEIDKLEISCQDPNAPIYPDVPDSPSIAQLLYARQDRNKRLLRRKPQHITDKAKQERIQAMNELHEWGIYIERKQRDTLQGMGIDVPKDFLNPFLNMTEEERHDRLRELDRKRYARNKPLERKLEIAKKQRLAKQEDNPYKTQ